jgi:hypothetical protein
MYGITNTLLLKVIIMNKNFFAETCSKCTHKADAIKSPIYRDEYILDGGCKMTGIESPRQEQCPILQETIANGRHADCKYCAESDLDKHLCPSDGWPCHGPRPECLSCGKILVDDTYASDLIFYCGESKCIVDIIAENTLLEKVAKIKGE